MFQKYYGWPDISISHAGGMAIWLLQYPLSKLFEGLGWKDAEKESDLQKMREDVGIFGDPMMVGLMVGLALGVLSQVGSGVRFYDGLVATIKVGMNAAAIMFIFPKMVAILMEGLIPVSDQARVFLEKRFKNSKRKFYIGMDTALLLGDDMVLTLGIVMIPITIAVGLLMPWNRIMPFGILTSLPYYMVILPPLTNRNFWKSVVIATIHISLSLTFGTFMAPDVTTAALESGYVLPEGASIVGLDGNIINFSLWALAKWIAR